MKSCAIQFIANIHCLPDDLPQITTRYNLQVSSGFCTVVLFFFFFLSFLGVLVSTLQFSWKKTYLGIQLLFSSRCKSHLSSAI